MPTKKRKDLYKRRAIVTSTKTPQQLAKEYGDYFMPGEDNRAYTSVIKEIAFLAGYKAAQQWISVKDRLPDIYQRVLILIRGRIFISSIEEEYGDEYPYGVIRFWDGDWDWPEVTHWMPLPEPPKQ